MLQIILISALSLMISQSSALSATIAYTFLNTVMLFCVGVAIFSLDIFPMILMKSVLVYFFFRILQDNDGYTRWWGYYFMGVPLIYLSDRFLGLPLVMAYSTIPFVDPWTAVGKPVDFAYSLPNLIRAFFSAKKEITGA